MPSTIPTSPLNVTQYEQPASMFERENLKVVNQEDLSTLSAEEKERKLFMADINKFMAEMGKPFSKIPIMGYKELDLFQLFREVTSYGGFSEVVKNVGTWSKIWKRLGNFDPSITDSSFRLKKNYERYLLDYEYKCFPEHKQIALEYERQQQLKKAQQLSGETKTESKKFLPKTLSPKLPKKAGTTSKRKSTFQAYKDVTRDKEGSPKMPLLLNELTVLNLGTIVPKSPYITEKHIFPVGFCSTRYFSSMKNPEQRVKYTSQIVDGGEKPQFVVTAEDDPMSPIVSHSPSGAWREVVKRLLGQAAPEKNISVSGALRFGLAHPIVASLIRELPGSAEAKNFTIQAQIISNCLPNKQRKRKQPGSESSSDSGEQSPPPARKKPYLALSDEEVFNDFDAVETAVQTLHALKHCMVY